MAAFSALFTASVASACSSTTQHVAPSNFELVQMADAIGIYTAHSGSDFGELPFGNLTFRLEQTISGGPPVELGLGFAQLGDPEGSSPSSEELEKPFKFHDYGGGCSRTGFDRGGRYLMILRRGDDSGGWAPIHYGGSRSKEAFGGVGSAWALTVGRYVALKALDPAQQRAVLARMLDRGEDPDGVALSALERADIDHHLRTPSQWKPTSWLVERYERAARGEEVDILLSGPIQWELRNDPRTTLLTSLANGSHPEALPLFKRLLTLPGLPARERGLALLYLARHGEYPLAFQWVERRLLAELPLLPKRDALALIGLINEMQRGDTHDDGKERWRSDPHALVAWPKLEPLISRYEDRLYEENRDP
jgi:hypothetical protein